MTNEQKKNIRDQFAGEVVKSPVKAIRAKCLDCCCWQPQEVAECPAKECPIWPFRFGVNPYREINLTDEQRAEIAKRLKKTKQG